MPRARLFFSEAFRSIGANLSTTVAATMTVLIGMFLLGLFIALCSWVNSWTDHVHKDVVVKVFFAASSPRRRKRRSTPSASSSRATPRRRPCVFVSKEEASKSMKSEVPASSPTDLVGNPLPDAFEVTPERRRPGVGRSRDRLRPAPAGVEKVDYAQKKTERILRSRT